MDNNIDVMHKLQFAKGRLIYYANVIQGNG